MPLGAARQALGRATPPTAARRLLQGEPGGAVPAGLRSPLSLARTKWLLLRSPRPPPRPPTARLRPEGQAPRPRSPRVPAAARTRPGKRSRPGGAARIRGGERQAFPVGERSGGRRRQKEPRRLPPHGARRPSTSARTRRSPRRVGQEGATNRGFGSPRRPHTKPGEGREGFDHRPPPASSQPSYLTGAAAFAGEGALRQRRLRGWGGQSS